MFKKQKNANQFRVWVKTTLKEPIERTVKRAKKYWLFQKNLLFSFIGGKLGPEWTGRTEKTNKMLLITGTV